MHMHMHMHIIPNPEAAVASFSNEYKFLGIDELECMNISMDG